MSKKDQTDTEKVDNEENLNAKQKVSQFHTRFVDSVDLIVNENDVDLQKDLSNKCDNSHRYKKNTHQLINKMSSSVDFKNSTIRQHYYPEGGWGYVVVVSAMFCHMITSGLQLSFGVFVMHLTRQPFGREKYMHSIWIGSLSLAMSCIISPIIVSWCHRKSARLTAIAGGLISSLGCLFASFASQFHQVLLSYGIFLSIGIGIARESANLMVGQYFKRKRNLIEIFVQCSIGIGIAIMSPTLNWCIGSFRHWRAGLQLITLALFSTFLIATLYRPASLYHPQRRAILHLKMQRRKIREKNRQTNKPPFFDVTPLKIRSIQVILVSTLFFSFGYLSPLFYLTKIAVVSNQTITDNNDDDDEDANIMQDMVIPANIINLNIYFGLSFAIGVIVFGYLTVNNSVECRINRQYLCQTSMILTAFIQIISIYLNDYFGYVMFVIIYGMSIGSYYYMHKVLVFGVVRAKIFGKAWSYIRCAESLPLLIGIPLTGYVNIWASSPTYHYGFIFSSIFCLFGALVLCALNPESRNILAYAQNELHPFHQHSCSTSEANDIRENRNADAVIDDNTQLGGHHCCKCGQILSPNNSDEEFKELCAVKAADDYRPSSPKRTRTLDDDDEDDEDEMYIQAPEGTFFSEDLYNYYMQNELEDDDDDQYYSNENLANDNVVSAAVADNECESEVILPTFARMHRNCDNSVKYANSAKRTIDTVTEEPSSLV